MKFKRIVTAVTQSVFNIFQLGEVFVNLLNSASKKFL
jgi:hypothetical protein